MKDYFEDAISFLTIIAAATIKAMIKPNSMTYPYLKILRTKKIEIPNILSVKYEH